MVEKINREDWENDFNFIQLYTKKLKDKIVWPEHWTEAKLSQNLLGEGYKVLDVGASAGHAYHAFKEHGCGYYLGVDIIEKLIDIGNEYWKDDDRCELKWMDVAKGIEVDEAFDVIILNTVIAHVIDWKKLLRDCNSVLKRGGYIMIRESVTKGETKRWAKKESAYNDNVHYFTHWYTNFNIDELREFFTKDLDMNVVKDHINPGPNYWFFAIRKKE